MKIGFIGTGVMGASMAGHLIKGGHEVAVYNRTKAKAETLLSQGAQWCDTPDSAAQFAELVITMVGYPKDVEEIYFGKQGILENAKPGTYVVDMTTSSPKLAQRIYDAAKAKGLKALDAPVSGGDVGARNGNLSIMVGGDAEDVEALRPIFALMGPTLHHQGGAGAGQHTKMCNQIAIAGTMLGVCEAVAYAEKAGLDSAKVLSSISSGAAGSWTMTNLAPRMIAYDDKPGFYIKHFIKDMRIALESAQEMGLLTPGLKLVKEIYDELAEQGMENKGTQALIQFYRE